MTAEGMPQQSAEPETPSDKLTGTAASVNTR